MKTSYQLFDPIQSEVQKTIVCFGTARGGTSMVAGAIHLLGIPMGKNLPVNIEDPSFVPENEKSQDPKTIENIKKTIAKRNQKYDQWGWKHPNAQQYLKLVHQDIRNPYYISVYRDPIPAVIRVSSRNNNKNSPPEDLWKIGDKRLQEMRLNTDFLLGQKRPALLVSYEKAIQSPVDFINELARFLGTVPPVDLSEMLDFMRGGSYKKLPE